MNTHELRAAIEALEVEAAGRRFTADEKKSWNVLNGELHELDVRRERLRALAGDPRHTEGPEDDREPRRRRSAAPVPAHLEQTRSEGLAAIDRMGGDLTAAAADRLEQIVEEDVAGPELGVTARYIAAVSDPNYLTAYGRLLAEPQGAHLRWSPKEYDSVQRVLRVEESKRALGIGSQGGAYPVPAVLDPTIRLTSDGALNPVRTVADVRVVTGNHWTGVASTGISASYDAEFSEVSDDSPTLTAPSADVEMARAWVPFSIELGEDWVGAQQELAKLIMDAKDTLESVKFLSGAGHASKEPQGIFTGATATSTLTTAATAVFAISDCYTLLEAIPARFRPRTSVLAHPTQFDRVYRMVGGGSTEPAILSDRGGPFLGYPKYEWSSMTSGATSNALVSIAGDIASGFTILDRVGLSLELVDHVFSTANARPTGSRGVFAWWRNTRVVTVPQAFRILKIL